MDDPLAVLHVWPGAWGLPSLDPICLTAILYAQLTIPGKFSLMESTSPTASPTGTLPYMVHDQTAVAPLSSLFKYMAGIGINLNSSLSSAEKAQSTAWCTHAEAGLGDLVTHMLFAQDANWREMVYPTLIQMYRVPQRYYAPRRHRASYKARLEAAELWVSPGEEVAEIQTDISLSSFKQTKKKEENHKARFARVFEREKILEKARAVLDIYARLLGQSSFFFGNKPTTLDVVVAANILLMVRPPFPDDLLPGLVKTSYPLLVSHADRVHSAAFPESHAVVPVTQEGFSLMSFIPRIF
ncbi:hypothetical protein BDZ89DRAFT_1004986 [Hymenopellis radicata]|nr:hypothetical protein BDZ89DRAFT_1004986 [Hymenopellis radicata]